MYQYHQKYNEHKDQLRQAYKSKEEEGTFKPAMNQRSSKLLTGTKKNFQERTMNQYLNKHKREDKHPDEIDYERSANECYFQPQISSSKPRTQIYNNKMQSKELNRNNSYNNIINNKK